jgi:uncharacterized protein YidB (DUF937 family)
MSFLDGLMKQSGRLGGFAQALAENPQVVSAAISLLNHKDPSVGGTGGLGGLVSSFEKAGLGPVIAQWISTGPNPPVTAQQVTSAISPDVLAQFAQKAGIPTGEAASHLAAILPGLIDHLTPNGEVPASHDLEGALGALLSGLGR